MAHNKAQDAASLAEALERYRDRKAAEEKKKRAHAAALPRLDMDLLRLLRGHRPGLMVELARHMGLSRTGLYRALQPAYGRALKGQKNIKKLNDLLLSIKKDVLKSLVPEKKGRP